MFRIYFLKKTMMKHNFKALEIWKRSRKLVKNTYLITKAFPSEEKFNLISQMNRSAVSIPSNIAEGCGRGTDGQLVYFLNIAIGSNCELETQFYLAFDIGYISKQILDKFTDEISQIRRMIIQFSKNHKK